MVAARLHEIAFGEFVGRDVDDPTAVVPVEGLHDLYLHAIALAGQGSYARAASDLRRVVAGSQGDGGAVLRSAAVCARASHRRQAGGHRRALVDDGVAMSLAVGAPDAVARRAALVDAVTGLAADRLGTGDLSGAGRLLSRAEEIGAGARLDDGPPWWLTGRTVLRTAWVRAEWHLYSGRGREAARAADHAAALARDCPSARHRLKTDLLVAASRAVVGELDGACERATDVAARARALRQRPLEWAACGLLADVASTSQDRSAARSRRDELGRVLEREIAGFDGSSS